MGEYYYRKISDMDYYFVLKKTNLKEVDRYMRERYYIINGQLYERIFTNSLNEFNKKPSLFDLIQC